MSELCIKANAKINLALDVVGKRSDGYHDIQTVMQSIGLFDLITLSADREDISISSNSDAIPNDINNIACKAAFLLKERFAVPHGAHIHIEKNIPVSAGLAGGSTDAAAVLFGLNKIWNLNLSMDDLLDLALKIGADVPFCLVGGTALAEGIGEIITPLKPLENEWLVLVKPPIEVSTKEVYNRFDSGKIFKKPNLPYILRFIQEQNIEEISKNMVNVLEDVTIKMYPEIASIKSDILSFGALGSIMSGSGPAVYGFFKDRKTASSAYEHLKGRYHFVYLVSTHAAGISLI